MPVCNCIGIDQWVQIFMIKVVLEPVTFLSSAKMRIGRFYGRMSGDEAKDIRIGTRYESNCPFVSAVNEVKISSGKF